MVLLFNYCGYSVSIVGVSNSSRCWMFFHTENKILSLFLVFSDLFYAGNALTTNILQTHWWTKIGKEMLFIPECMIQIGFKGMFFLWNFASFLPSTLLHLTLFRAWSKGNIGITREEKRPNKKKIKKWKKRKAELSLQSLNYIKNIETQHVAWLWIIFFKRKKYIYSFSKHGGRGFFFFLNHFQMLKFFQQLDFFVKSWWSTYKINIEASFR